MFCSSNLNEFQFIKEKPIIMFFVLEPIRKEEQIFMFFLSQFYIFYLTKSSKICARGCSAALEDANGLPSHVER